MTCAVGGRPLASASDLLLQVEHRPVTPDKVAAMVSRLSSARTSATTLHASLEISQRRPDRRVVEPRLFYVWDSTSILIRYQPAVGQLIRVTKRNILGSRSWHA